MTQIKIESVRERFEPFTLESMEKSWPRLHAGDCEAWPAKVELQEAWLLFHNGFFKEAAEKAGDEAASLSVKLKALSTYAHYLEADPETKVRLFLKVSELAQGAIESGSIEDPNVHYQIAYSLGRYGQFISVAKALSEGLAGKVEHALKECLTLAPKHADAHTALATYQAEIIGKLGKIAAKLTYNVKPDAALSLYEKGMSLAPNSVSAKTEFADGLLTLFGKKQLKSAVDLYEKAAAANPIDALETMDVFIAEQELAAA